LWLNSDRNTATFTSSLVELLQLLSACSQDHPGITVEILPGYWYHGSRFRAKAKPHYFKALELASPSSPGEGAPIILQQAPAVKGLIVRSRTGRGEIAPRSLGKLLREGFVNLEWMRLERWTNAHFVNELGLYTGETCCL
jgi:hypothetical protein